MGDEIKITEVEATKLNLQPNDILMVTIRNDQVDEYSIQALKSKLEPLFPNNRIMIFAMGTGDDVRFTVANQEEVAHNDCKDCKCKKQ